MSDQYKFIFNADNTAVLSMVEVERGREKAQRIVGSNFSIETDGAAVASVTRTKTSSGVVETSIFSDQDANGLFEEDFDIDVVTSSVRASKLEKYKFTIDGSDNITAVFELKKGRWKADRIDADEDYSTEVIGGKTYVLKTEQEINGLEFELFRDDNGDGVWTKIADGDVATELLDPDTGTIDLVGLQPYLEASSSLVG